MNARNVLAIVFASLSSSMLAGVAGAGSPPITFEDVYGACGDASLVLGPTPTTIGGVHFATPDANTFNVGQSYSSPAGLGNPFASDSLPPWTFGSGAVLTFATPITSLEFDAGVFTNQATFPTFEVISGGVVITTFGANLTALTPVSAVFSTPTTQVTLKFVGGSSSLLGIDDLVSTRYDGTPYCFGDGSGTACPCANTGAAGRGCANTVAPQGALLQAFGIASLSSDTFVLQGSDMPNSSALYFQGTLLENGGLGSVLGDGLRCVSGSIVRLGTKTNVAGASQYPTGSDPSVSVKGLVAVPGNRTYQIWYRNSAAFCTPSTFNLTNGWQVLWTP